MGDLDFDVIGRTWPYLLEGLQYTVQLTLVAAFGGTVFGTLLAMARLSSFKPLALLASGYVNLMRSLPLLLVIFWFYFLVPVLVQLVMGWERPAQIGAERSAYVTFIMFQAAYYCEIMRSGIQSIPRGQVWAGQALGMNYFQTKSNIVLPQAIRPIVPALGNYLVAMFKDTPVLSAITVVELMLQAKNIGSQSFRYVEPITLAGLFFLIISIVVSLLVRKLEARLRLP